GQIFPRPELAIGTGPHIVAGLGRNDDLVAIGAEIAGQHLAEQLLGRAWRGTVIVGEVEMGDAPVEGVTQDFEGGIIVAGATEILPETERDDGEFQARFAAAAVLHGCVARVGGTVGHRTFPWMAERMAEPIASRPGLASALSEW